MASGLKGITSLPASLFPSTEGVGARGRKVSRKHLPWKHQLLPCGERNCLPWLGLGKESPAPGPPLSIGRELPAGLRVPGRHWSCLWHFCEALVMSAGPAPPGRTLETVSLSCCNHARTPGHGRSSAPGLRLPCSPTLPGAADNPGCSDTPPTHPGTRPTQLWGCPPVAEMLSCSLLDQGPPGLQSLL